MIKDKVLLVNLLKCDLSEKFYISYLTKSEDSDDFLYLVWFGLFLSLSSEIRGTVIYE